MTVTIKMEPHKSPAKTPLKLCTFLYINDAVHAKLQVETIFIINPISPVSLTLNISIKDTATDMKKAASGPRKNPPIVTMTSLGSYFRKSTTGTLQNIITRYDIVQNIPVMVNFLVFDIISSVLSLKIEEGYVKYFTRIYLLITNPKISGSIIIIAFLCMLHKKNLLQ